MVTLAQRQKWAHLDLSLTFENFQVTPANQAAIETVRTLLADPLKYSPLIIVGPKGSGKSHLLHAIGNTLAATDPKLRIRCQTAEDFCNHNSRFIRKRRNSDYFRYYFGLNAALTDDIQWLQDSEDAQESFFLPIGTLLDMAKWVAFTCKSHPLETQWNFVCVSTLIKRGTLIQVNE